MRTPELLVGLGRAVAGWGQSADSNRTGPPDECLARRYAGCRDFSRCDYCSPLEQALRAAAQLANENG